MLGQNGMFLPASHSRERYVQELVPLLLHTANAIKLLHIPYLFNGLRQFNRNRSTHGPVFKKEKQFRRWTNNVH